MPTRNSDQMTPGKKHSTINAKKSWIENHKRSDEFEMYEFERIDPRGRTPLHLGKFLPKTKPNPKT